MVQQALEGFWGWWGGLVQGVGSVAGWLGLALGLAAVLGLALYVWGREGFGPAVGWVSRHLRWLGLWAGVALVLGLGLWGLQTVGQAVLLKYNTEARAQYSSTEDPDVGPTLQYGPAAAYISERTYARTFTLPPEFLLRLGRDGLGILAPYLTDPSAENVTRLADTFRRSGRDVVFTREVTQLSETPITFDSAEVQVNLRFSEAGPGGRRSFYNAEYTSSYTFRNPLTTPAKVRFVFPLPEQSGTLREFTFSVGGQSQPDPDRYDNYAWEGEIAAGEKVTAVVRYKHQGAGSWSYNIGSGRRPIKAFKLTLNSDRPVRFLRGALYPTAQRGGNLTWELQNVITSQQIEVFFPNKQSRLETLTKVFSFLPFTLVLLLGWCVALAQRYGLSLTPAALALGLLGLTVGQGIGGVLSSYLPLGWALLLGGWLAAVLAYRALGRGFWLPSAVVPLLPLVFLSGGHAGLLLALVALLGLLSLLWSGWQQWGPQGQRIVP